MEEEIFNYKELISKISDYSHTLKEAYEMLDENLPSYYKYRPIHDKDKSLVGDITIMENRIDDIRRHVEGRIKHIIKEQDPGSIYRDVEFAVTRQIPCELGHINEMFNRKSQFDEYAKGRLERIEHLCGLRDSIECSFREMGGLKQRRDNQKSEYAEDEVKFFLRVKEDCSDLLDDMRKLRAEMEHKGEFL